MNHITKPIKTSVAVFLKNPINAKEFLIVKRPPEDEDLPNVYGLPAGTIKNGELPEQAVIRIGKEKLNTEIKPSKFVGSKYIDRGSYILILMDIEANLLGKAPNVADAVTTNTKYVDQMWTSDYTKLVEAASKGSLCTQIILDTVGMSY